MKVAALDCVWYDLPLEKRLVASPTEIKEGKRLETVFYDPATVNLMIPGNWDLP